MRIVKKHLSGTSIAKALLRSAPTAALPYSLRRRSRQKITLDDGEQIGLVLEQRTILRHGDALLAEDGRLILVQAAPDDVLRITAESDRQLTRAAYHLGNRHVALEVGEGYLQLEYDPVLRDMLRRLGGVSVRRLDAPFEPESGAYGGGHKHGHDETFSEDYALAQAAYAAHDHPHTHGHEHTEDPGHEHVHGQDCNHGAHHRPKENR